MKANTVTKLAVGIALSIAVAFGTTAMVNAQEAAAPAAAKSAKVPDACKKLDEASCKASADKNCRWLPTRTVNGEERKARCRTKIPNPCAGLDELACNEKADKRCSWITTAVNAKGKTRKPFCRLMPAKN